MKKILSILMMLTIFSCGSKDKKASDDTYTIGITQIVSHPALDIAKDGFVDGLKELGVNAQIIEKNANGEIATANLIANGFINQNVDLIYAVATPVAQAAANATKDIPIVFSAVTDPAQSGLIQDNVTGVSDYVDIKAQFEMLSKFDNIKTIGFIYNSSEKNSAIQLELAKKAASELGLDIVAKAVTQSSEIPQALSYLLSKSDALYTPTDNLVASVMPLIASKALEQGKIVFGSEKAHVDAGALLTKGIDYYELGKKASKIAKEILVDKKSPKTIQYQIADLTELAVNEDTLKALNIQLPEGIK